MKRTESEKVMNRYLKILAISLFLSLPWASAWAQQANDYWCNSATVPCPPSAWTPTSAAAPKPVTITAPNTASVTNPTSQLTLTSSTTAYSVGNLVASSATAGSVVVPSFAIANSAGAGQICSLDLTSDDSASTAWGGVTVQIDLWRTAPTFTNGDHAAYVIATGSANFIGTLTGTYGPAAGDGAYARLVPVTGDCFRPKLASGTSIFWTEQVLLATGVLTANKHQTVTAEVTN